MVTHCYWLFIFFFFFQAEDGIRDVAVTGVQTCALPISKPFDEPHVKRFCLIELQLVRRSYHDAGAFRRFGRMSCTKSCGPLGCMSKSFSRSRNPSTKVF